MYEVAKKERSDLFTSLFLLGPAITALFLVALICSYKSLSNLNQKGFFELIFEFELNIEKVLPQVSVLGKRFWEEFEKGFFFISAGTGTAVVLLIKKSKFDNLRTRIKEVSDYLPELNLSILRFNK